MNYQANKEEVRYWGDCKLCKKSKEEDKSLVKWSLSVKGSPEAVEEMWTNSPTNIRVKVRIFFHVVIYEG